MDYNTIVLHDKGKVEIIGNNPEFMKEVVAMEILRQRERDVYEMEMLKISKRQYSELLNKDLEKRVKQSRKRTLKKEIQFAISMSIMGILNLAEHIGLIEYDEEYVKEKERKRK